MAWISEFLPYSNHFFIPTSHSELYPLFLLFVHTSFWLFLNESFFIPPSLFTHLYSPSVALSSHYPLYYHVHVNIQAANGFWVFCSRSCYANHINFRVIWYVLIYRTEMTEPTLLSFWSCQESKRWLMWKYFKHFRKLCKV